MRYETLLVKFEDPLYLAQHRSEANDRQRIYAKDSEYRRKRAQANAAYKDRLARGQPARVYNKRIQTKLPVAANFTFAIVKEITVSFE